MSTAIALEAKQRCPGCHSHAEREEGGICTYCRQHQLLLRLVVDMARACDTVAKAYATEPHPAIASLKAEIVTISRRVNKAAGVE
jgi:hypothetical protein